MSLPAEERHFLEEVFTSPGVLEGWIRPREGQALSLVALAQGRIVAQGRVSRRRGPAWGHVGHIRVTVSPSFRGRGLGTALLRELCEMAAAAGLGLLLAEVVEEVEEEALRALEWLGFMRTGTIADGARGPKGERHDLLLLALPLERWSQWTRF